MEHRTCHRRGYELLTPEVWEVFDGMESKGFVKNLKNQKSDPPIYRAIADSDLGELPKGSIIQTRKWEDEYPPHLQGPEVNEIRDTKEQTIYDLKSTIQKLQDECGELFTDNKQLEHKLKHKMPSGSVRWKLEYIWTYGKEVHWDFKRKNDAVAYMEHIQNFFGSRLVESIKDIKYIKYIYGTRGIKQDETSDA